MDRRYVWLRGALALLAALALVACGRSDTSGQTGDPAGGQPQGTGQEWWTGLAGAGAPLGAIPPEAALAGTAWELERLRGQPPVAASQVTLAFSDTQMGGRACNTYGGPYTLDQGGLFRASKTSRTLMACGGNGVMLQEEQYMQALNDSARYRREGDRLTLLSAADEELLVFRQATGSEPLPASQGEPTTEQLLTSGVWVQRGRESFEPLAEGATLRFEGGQLSVQVGCLRLSGPYETSGSRIRLLHQYNAEQLCTPGPDEPRQTRAFLERLGQARFVWLQAGTLLLETREDKRLEFVSLPADRPAPAPAPLSPGTSLIDPQPGATTPPSSDLPAPGSEELPPTWTPAINTAATADPAGAIPTPELTQSSPGEVMPPSSGGGGAVPGSSGPSLPVVTTGPTPTPR
ncbi:MAG: hypothetical protein OHK0022_37180 [Roseiflexaceae bacterium]